MAGEEWREVRGYPNYQVSSFGRVKNRKHDRVLRKSLTSNGYEKVRLYNNGKGDTKTVHVLVARNFYPNSVGQCVNHKDRNKRNNSVENLEVTSYRENYHHSMKHSKKYSKYPGVSFYKKIGKWSAGITIGNDIVV